MDQDQRTLTTDLGTLRIARAGGGDLERVMRILDDATAWLEARGIDQWHPDPGLRARIAGRIERGEMWLGWLSGEAVATLALQWADEEMWGIRPPDAGYVHGLAVRRAYAGHDIGRALLDWAAGEVARAGRTYLRLDCVAHNVRLRAYYTAAGFTYRGDRAYADGEGESSLFERRVSPHADAIPQEASRSMDQAYTVASPAGPLIVQRAEAGDVDAVTALYEETTNWMRARGFDPGEAPRPMREIVADRIASGVVYVARLAGEAVATMTLLRQDIEVWGERPDDALYLHGFGVKRAYAGREIGLALLGWLARVAADDGRSFVRLDCMASNPKLRDYYERAGFTYRGDITLARYTGSRYEKPVGAG